MANKNAKQRWANDASVAHDDIYYLVQDRLRVNSIATPRNRLFVCRRSEKIDAVIQRNINNFDHVPVVDDHAGSGFIGILDLRNISKQNVSGTVASGMDNLNEHSLIGGDASIINFIKSADKIPCRLVISRDQVTGLVNLSDLQKLPVRVAIFSLLTALETLMSDVISANWEEAQWLGKLSYPRRAKVLDATKSSKKGDGFIQTILFTQFCDKKTILLKSYSQLKKFSNGLKRIQELRDNIAHANDYASTADDACSLCQTVRDIEMVRMKLKEILFQVEE